MMPAVLLCLQLFSSSAYSADITGPDVWLQEKELRVTTSLLPDNKLNDEMQSGVTKEFRFYIDLFKVWKMWPDEFVTGKTFTRTVKNDPVKKEFVATSFDGHTITEKRFKSFDSMMLWAMHVNSVSLAHLKELEPGVYFIRTTVESKARKLPPVLGYFIIFLSENEFRITKESAFFSLGNGK
jgi:hypothetical protein